MSQFRSTCLPKNGTHYRVLVIARISTKNQDLQSLDDQIAICKNRVGQILDGPTEFVIIKSQESGELLDRQTLVDALSEVEKGQIDLVILEDLARLSRRTFSNYFCEICADNKTRLIAINDHIDTASENYAINVLVTSFLHDQHNLKASHRIKERKREKFKGGGALACQVYGFFKPAGAKNDQELQKDPSCQWVFDEIFRLLEDGASYSEVADFLNDNNIPPGPFCRLKRWDCRMVSRLVMNPILKGVRERNRKESRRINKTGKHRSVNASPEMLLQRNCPHLAFIEAERYDRLITMLKVRNANYARGRAQRKPDSRIGVSKKSTIWPGQHLRCGICGRHFLWGGHGAKDHMMCSGNRDYKCWNSASVDGHLAAKLLTQAVLERIARLPEFDAVFLQKLQEELVLRRETRVQELARLEAVIRGIQEKIDRIVEAIASGTGGKSLAQRLPALELELSQAQMKRDRIRLEPTQQMNLPSMGQICKEAAEAINSLASDSPEFGRLMNRLIPSLKVFPVRCCDGGAVVLRATATLDLTSLARLPQVDPSTLSVFQTQIVVDLFEQTQRVAFREKIVEMRQKGLTEAVLAKELGLTITAAQRASSLTRRMEQLGIKDPFIPLSQPPNDITRWRRHLHKRFHFEPLAQSVPDVEVL